jgi:hypothetical protein
MEKMENIAGQSVILSALTTVWNILKEHWVSDRGSVLAIATILAYLIGHTVKVFSRIKYEFLTAIFDKGLNRPVTRLYNKAKSWIFPKDPYKIKPVLRPFKNLIASIFTFETVSYSPKDKIIRQNSLNILNDSLKIELPDDEYSIVKISAVITNQEKLRSLGTFYLAKYNLYRSLAMIFLFTTFYYLYFYKVTDSLLSATSREISCIVLLGPIIFWYTFHEKYKRYWNLYGGERLMSLFYFLNKKKLNERG